MCTVNLIKFVRLRNGKCRTCKLLPLGVTLRVSLQPSHKVDVLDNNSALFWTTVLDGCACSGLNGRGSLRAVGKWSVRSRSERHRSAGSARPSYFGLLVCWVSRSSARRPQPKLLLLETPVAGRCSSFSAEYVGSNVDNPSITRARAISH